jgi:hypothetical protein
VTSLEAAGVNLSPSNGERFGTTLVIMHQTQHSNWPVGYLDNGFCDLGGHARSLRGMYMDWNICNRIPEKADVKTLDFAFILGVYSFHSITLLSHGCSSSCFAVFLSSGRH